MNIATGEEIRSWQIADLGFSILGCSRMVAVPDGQHILLYSQYENKILVFNPLTDDVFALDSEYNIRQIEFSSDSSIMVASFRQIVENERIILWDTSDGITHGLQPKLIFTPSVEDIIDLAVSPDNRYVIGSTFQGEIVLWDAMSGEQVKVLEWSRPNWFSSIQFAFNPDGNMLAVNAQQIHLFDTADYTETRIIIE